MTTVKEAAAMSMTTIKATAARIPPEIFSAVASGGEPVRVEKFKQAVYIVNEHAIMLLQYMEDQLDLQEAEKAMAEIESGEDTLISWDEAKAQL